MESITANTKFLVIQTASIGDVILATAVLEKLHSSFPEAEIAMVVKRGCEELFMEHPFLKKVIIWDKKKKKYRHLFRIIREARREHYDYVININRFASSGILTAFSGGKFKSGFNKNPFSFFYNIKVPHRIGLEWPTHETIRNHELIRSLTDGQAGKMRIYPTPDDFKFVAAHKEKPYITIAPASLWKTKQFPAEKWVEFINNIFFPLNVYLLGSKNDKYLVGEIIRKSQNRNLYDMAGKLDLLQTAALMQNARMNFTNDSAPLHLASAVNAPVSAIFCSTVPEFGFGPLSDDSSVIETPEKLKCRPCGLHGMRECPLHTMACAYGIPLIKLTERIRL